MTKMKANQLITAMFVIGFGLLSTDRGDAQIPSQDNDQVKMVARYHLQSGTNQGFLIVKLEIAEGSHIYSLTQSSPLRPSQLVVKQSPDFAVGKRFKADKPPTVVAQDPVFRARVEKHSGTVQFYVPIQMASAANLESVRPEVSFSGQVCSDAGYCAAISGMTTKAKFAGFFERQAENDVPPLQQRK